MLEETARDRVDADGVANAGDTRLEAVESRTTQSMRAPAWLARYKALMHFSLTSELHLVLIHAGCLPLRRSPRGVFDEAGAGVARAAERRLGRAPGQLLEQACEILVYGRVARQRAQAEPSCGCSCRCRCGGSGAGCPPSDARRVAWRSCASGILLSWVTVSVRPPAVAADHSDFAGRSRRVRCAER